MDAQTFVTMIIVNMQAGMLPNIWRYVSYESIKALLINLKATPMSDTKTDVGSLNLFRRHSSAAVAEREFINWRRAFLMLILMSGPCPSIEQKREYFTKL